MLACLTRGNSLDVLQEGFNEVTGCPAHPPARSRWRRPPQLREGSSSAPSSPGPEDGPPQSPEEAKVVGTVLSSLVESKGPTPRRCAGP